MFETYRMLGREREAELLREAERLQDLTSSALWARLVGALSRARQAIAPARFRARAELACDLEPYLRWLEDQWRADEMLRRIERGSP